MGIFAAPAGGTFRIAGNVVAGGPAGGLGWGIRISSFDPSVVTQDFEVSGNVVYATNPAASGIRVYSPGSAVSITQNELHMDLDSIDASDSNGADIGAIVVNGSDHMLIGQNRFFGTSFCGVCLYGSSSCSVVGNNFTKLVVPPRISEPDYGATSADVVFGLFDPLSANNNVAVGLIRSVSDAGTGNSVAGSPSFRGGVGHTIANARQP
jgi:parallel beta-helix repeat protein